MEGAFGAGGGGGGAGMPGGGGGIYVISLDLVSKLEMIEDAKAMCPNLASSGMLPV